MIYNKYSELCHFKVVNQSQPLYDEGDNLSLTPFSPLCLCKGGFLCFHIKKGQPNISVNLSFFFIPRPFHHHRGHPYIHRAMNHL